MKSARKKCRHCAKYSLIKNKETKECPYEYVKGNDKCCKEFVDRKEATIFLSSAKIGKYLMSSFITGLGDDAEVSFEMGKGRKPPLKMEGFSLKSLLKLRQFLTVTEKHFLDNGLKRVGFYSDEKISKRGRKRPLDMIDYAECKLYLEENAEFHRIHSDNVINCPLCASTVKDGLYTDGKFIWPVLTTHLIIEHLYRPPKLLLKHILAQRDIREEREQKRRDARLAKKAEAEAEAKEELLKEEKQSDGTPILDG